MGDKKTALVLLLILAYSIPYLIVLVSAEPSWVLWSQTYGGTENDGNFSVYVVETSDGGFAIASNTQSFGEGSGDFWLIKTDASGKMEWNQTYGGTKVDHPYALIQASDGGYALAGGTKSFGDIGSFNVWLVKTDIFGNLLWNRTYGGGEAGSLVETSSGGYALTSGNRLIKTDDYGNLEWTQTYNGSALSLVETSDGGFALAGGADDDFWLAKTDDLGNMEWNNVYGGDKLDVAESVVQTSDGGFALVGTTESFPDNWTDWKDCWLIKTDKLGNKEWDKTYGGEKWDWGHSLILTSDNGFAIAGASESFGDYGFWLVKRDSSGNIEWSRTYGGSERDEGESVIQTSDGGYVLAGHTQSYGLVGSDIHHLKSDIWLVRTNEQGIPEFPSWVILPLFLIATFSALVLKKRLNSKY